MLYRNVPRKWTKSFKKFALYNFSHYNSTYINVLEQCNNFLDTAKKLQEMDYVVCADNVILHLAGALGIKTYALFTLEYETIWHNLNEENVGWYKSVKPFICETENDWKPLIMRVKNLIENRNS
jgi:ADP-heptose:LPS heptosyltransferase